MYVVVGCDRRVAYLAGKAGGEGVSLLGKKKERGENEGYDGYTDG